MNKNFVTSLLLAPALIICLSAPILADTIRLKDGSVIRGQVVGFKDQQFMVLVGAGARGGRRSQISLYMEDIESIEFDSATTTTAASASPTTSDETGTIPSTAPVTTTTPTPRPTPTPRVNPTQSSTTSQNTGTVNTQPASSRTSLTFFPFNTRVRADDTSNGWTNTGLVVRRGQRLRIRATGSVSLGAGRSSTPAGVATIQDPKKLMPNEPTGGIIAVIGDDNDDFIFVGRSSDFVAQRDGTLFLGVNEANLTDNTGAYDVVIEAEAISTRR